MLKKLGFYGLLIVMIIVTSMQVVRAEDFESKKIYQCTWTDNQLTTPSSWVNSVYFNDPVYKEVRFQDYGTKADIPAGVPRETSFYMTYGKDGLNIYFQSNETETDADGKLKGSSLEIFLSVMTISTSSALNEHATPILVNFDESVTTIIFSA
jgi:hypothetical protein